MGEVEQVVDDAGRADQARFLSRQLSLPVSTMSQWWVKRSSSAVVILASPNTALHSAKCWRWCKSASIRWRGRVFDFRPVRGLEVGVKKRWPREGPSVFWIGRDGRQKGSSGSNPGGG